MFKRILIAALAGLLISGCKTMSKSEYSQLHQQAEQAAALEAENTRLKQQQARFDELSLSLQQEVNDKQVMIEQLANRVIKVTLQNAVLFPSGDFTLNSNGKRILDKLVPSLKESASGKLVRITGHTDNLPVSAKRDSYIDNWDLSARRAADVVRYFVWAHKLHYATFRVEGRSFAEPVASNESEEGRAKNRRIEIFIE